MKEGHTQETWVTPAKFKKKKKRKYIIAWGFTVLSEKKEVIAQKEMALSRAVSWSQIQDVTDTWQGWQGLIGNADTIHVCLITYRGAVMILAQT